MDDVSVPSDTKRRPRDGEIARIAEWQRGLVTVSQLMRLGLSREAIKSRAAAGRLYRVHQGVYAVGYRAPHPHVGFHAAVLAAGDGAVLSHVSAGVLWGLVVPRHGAGRPVDVTVSRRPRARAGIRVHRRRTLADSERSNAHGIPVTAPGRTLLDLAAVLPVGVVRRAVREAEVRGLVDHGDLVRQLTRWRGRRGAPVLRAIVSVGPAPTRSELEDRTLALLLDHGLPKPRINAIVLIGEREFEVDFLFAEAGLIIEADGERYHGGAQARRADAARQAELEAAGYRVMRVTWRQVVDTPEQTVQRIRRVLPPPRDQRFVAV